MTLRNNIFRILYSLGYGNYLLQKNRKKSKIPVLVFHKVIPEIDSVWPGIHPKLFEEIILLLKKHYTILPLTDLTTKTTSELKDACFITFDDGYKDFLDYAYPILKQHHVPSALFILPNDITNNGHIWTSTIIFFIKHYSFDTIDAFFKQYQLNINYVDVFNDFQLNLDITKRLSIMQQSERCIIIQNLQKKFIKDDKIIEHELLNFDELRLLNTELVSINSHSLTHPCFLQEKNELFIENELKESKKIIEQELKIKVNAFAFPFAKLNEISHRIAKRYYEFCFTKINDFVYLKKRDADESYRYDMARFNVHQDTAQEVFFLINGFHSMFKK